MKLSQAMYMMEYGYAFEASNLAGASYFPEGWFAHMHCGGTAPDVLVELRDLTARRHRYPYVVASFGQIIAWRYSTYGWRVNPPNTTAMTVNRRRAAERHYQMVLDTIRRIEREAMEAA